MAHVEQFVQKTRSKRFEDAIPAAGVTDQREIEYDGQGGVDRNNEVGKEVDVIEIYLGFSVN